VQNDLSIITLAESLCLY